MVALGDPRRRDRRIDPQEHDVDRRISQGGAPVRLVDRAGGRADHARLGAGQGVEQMPQLELVQGEDPVAGGEVPGGQPGRGLEVGVGVAMRPAQGPGQAGPDRGLATAHQPQDDDVPRSHGPMLAASRQTGRSTWPARRRRAHDEPDAATRASEAGSKAVSPSPAAAHASRMPAWCSPPRVATPGMPSDGTTETRTSTRATRGKRAGDARQRGGVETQDAAQQRSPWEGHGHEVGRAGQDTVRPCQRLDAGGQEDGVRDPSALGTPGRLGHRGGGGIEADDELVGRTRRRGPARHAHRRCRDRGPPARRERSGRRLSRRPRRRSGGR